MDRRKLLTALVVAPFAGGLVPGRAIANNDPPGPGDPPGPYLGPPLQITLAQPMEAGSLVALALAPTVDGGVETAKVVLHLWIANIGPDPVQLTGITIVFPGLAQPTFVMQDIGAVFGDLPIGPGVNRQWTNAGYTVPPNDTPKSNEIWLQSAVPPTVRLELTAAGYAQPYVIVYELVPYQLARPLPFNALDLRQDEYVSVFGAHASGGADGGQVWAHDIGLAGWNGMDWSHLLPDTDGSANEHHRAWLMPIRAVADGVVVLRGDDVPDNPKPGVESFPANGGAGNFVWLLHDDGTMSVYLHMHHGTVTVQLNDVVSAGQILGHLGNAGSSSAPHVHLEVSRYSVNPNQMYRRPWAIRDAWLVEQQQLAPWDLVQKFGPTDDRGVPHTSTLIWPSVRRPGPFGLDIDQYLAINWPPEPWLWGIAEAQEIGQAPGLLDVWVGPGGPMTSSVFSADSTGWAILNGLDETALTAALAEAASTGHLPTSITAYLQKGAARYSAIVRTGSPTTGYVGVDPAEHARRSAALAKKGYQPLTVSMVAPAGAPQIAACFTKDAVGQARSVVLQSTTQFDSLIADAARSGLHPVHIQAAGYQKSVVYAAVFHEQAGGTKDTLVRRDLAETALRAESLRQQDQDRRIRALTSYVQGDSRVYLAAWR